ncbi:MAG: SDR family oxidoreductase [Xanthomonadales bacterium]|nr:SDR family oxidoreductase [Xanthomonadales bacterium]
MPDAATTTTPESTDPSRWALVTGASAGIGATFCRHLAARGYHLVLIARRADRLHTLADELREAHGTASLVLPADLADPGAAAAIEKRLREEDIHVEFLVNNAGYGVPGRFTDPDWSEHHDFIQVMMTAVCELTWRLLPGMQSRRKGYVINVASVAGLVPGSEGHTLYGASKAFLIRFSESLALENRHWNVHVSALCPGFTYSEFHDVTGTRELANQLPGFMWLEPDRVVAYGIESVQRENPRTIAIPGLFYRVLVGLVRYVPGVGRLFLKRMSKRFRKLD